MKRTVLLAVLVAWPTLAQAQNWSAHQKEIIEQVRRCNDGWVASIKQKEFKTFDDVCPETSDAVFWYTSSDAPAAYGGPKGVWAGSSSQNRSVTWDDMQPVTVQIDGDLAFIYYVVTWTVEPNTGVTRRSRSRRLTVFERRDGRWLMAGGTIAAVK